MIVCFWSKLIESISFAPIILENKFNLLGSVPVCSKYFSVRSPFRSDSYSIWSSVCTFSLNRSLVQDGLVWISTDEHSYCEVGVTTCCFGVMEAATLVMLLVIIPVLWLPDAILAFVYSSDVDLIASLFEDWRIVFSGAISSLKECRTCLLRERDERQRSPTEHAKNL